jgi:hypothetical protein
LTRFDPATGEVEPFDLEVGWSVASWLDGSLWAMGWDGSLTKIVLIPPEGTPIPSGSRGAWADSSGT